MYQPEDLRADLLYLRKGAGYTPKRLASRPALVAVLGGRTEPPELLVERLESAIRSLHDPDSELLLGIYGLDSAHGPATLAARRDAAASRLGIGREAVADRDTAAVERLLRQLLTGWYPKSPAGIRIPEYHNGFIQHAVNVTTYVRDHRHLESQHSFRLFALFDGVQYVTFTMSYPTPPKPLGTGWSVRTEEIPGGWQHEFWRQESMRRGHTYDLAYRLVNPDPNEPYWLHEESLAFHEPTRFARFTVHFLGQPPTTAWQFSGLTALQRPGAPSANTQLSAETDGTITATFRDIYGGLYCGLAWEWK
ncbi:hypothetical protein EII12_08275 [Buchananella hordeovulneris]|uniref:hypothetical protein n=1 Tax=Buchananella hordeovulneris TaxID=52770 RepID=UPI000F5DADFA|nr:hypothetical protein [Buchananella hordeovulneris]RRD51562.1 hypothetical protein EII12_08275 [Buchananella hordeovulneris]